MLICNSLHLSNFTRVLSKSDVGKPFAKLVSSFRITRKMIICSIQWNLLTWIIVNEDLQQGLVKIQIFNNCSKSLSINALLVKQQGKTTHKRKLSTLPINVTNLHEGEEYRSKCFLTFHKRFAKWLSQYLGAFFFFCHMVFPPKNLAT